MFRMETLDSNEVRYFCRNELEASMDNDGGVAELHLIDCYYYKDVVYPDEWRLPIFSREELTGDGYRVYGAALQLYTEETNGRVLLHRPTVQSFTLSYLFGKDEEQSYEFLMDNGRLLWECTCSTADRQDVLLCFDRNTLYHGEQPTFKDQHRGSGSTQSGDHYKEAGVELNVDLPSLNGVVQVDWTAEPFDEKRQVLLIRGTAQYPYGTETYVLAIGADAPITAESVRDMTVLRMPWESRESIRVGAALAKDEEAAIASLREGITHYTALREAQLKAYRDREQAANTVQNVQLPFATEFGRAAASYLDALMVGPMKDGRIGVRASAGKYGYFSIWDTIYPIRDFLWNGRYEDAARILRYLLNLPAMENTPIGALHLIAEWNEAMAFLPDGLLEDVYPQLRRLFDFALRLTEPECGLLLCKGNTGVDKPKQVGLSGLFASPDVNGLWYSACRIMRNEAMRHGDEQTVAATTLVIDKMDRGFRRVLFDEEAGYLRIGANRDLSPASVDVFHNALTLGYDYPYGMYLMRDIADRLAYYQSHRLWHPFGHRAVAYDSRIPAAWWKYVHMNQHNGHEMKLQRTAGNTVEIYRVMGELMKRSDRWKIAEETTNFSRFSIAPSQVCNWQTFAATGDMEALRAGVAGILRHRGGWYYLPADDRETVCLHNVPIADTVQDITISGEGAFATLYCDNMAVFGTLQVPADRMRDGTWSVRRTHERPLHPVLMNAIDLPIYNIATADTTLSFVCGDTVHTPIQIAASKKPHVTVNGDTLTVAWDESSHMLWIDRLWTAGEKIVVRM